MRRFDFTPLYRQSVGFDHLANMIEQLASNEGDNGFPPYNIERIPHSEDEDERLRITLAVAGFTTDQLDVSTEENQLVIRGKQQDEQDRHYLHRGIAARQFQRTFVLAEGIEILSADLKDGLLSIDLVRPQQVRTVRKINISSGD